MPCHTADHWPDGMAETAMTSILQIVDTELVGLAQRGRPAGPIEPLA